MAKSETLLIDSIVQNRGKTLVNTFQLFIVGSLSSLSDVWLRSLVENTEVDILIRQKYQRKGSLAQPIRNRYLSLKTVGVSFELKTYFPIRKWTAV